MKVIQKKITVKAENYYKTHLSIINPILPVSMTEKEIEVLSAFLSLPEDIIGVEVFNTYARKLVKDKLLLSSGSLSNHLRTLINKKFLEKDKITNRINIKEFLLPEKNKQGYQFILTYETEQ